MSPHVPSDSGLPSYEHSVQEKRARRSRIVDDQGFPIYNAAAFEAVANSYHHPSSSTHTSTRDLKLAVNSLKSSRSPMHNGRPSRLVIVDGPADDSDDSNEHESPPPPFTPTVPSSDRSPFEQVVRIPYQGPDSRPSSPLVTPPFHPSRHIHSFQPPPSPHVSPRPSHRPSPSMAFPSGPSAIARPSSPAAPAVKNDSTAMTSRLPFDPLVAYAKPRGSQGSPTYTYGGASAFYNPAITSHLSARSPSTYPNTGMSTPFRTHRVTPSLSLPPQASYGMHDQSDRSSMYSSVSSSSASSSSHPFAVSPSNRPLAPPPGAGMYRGPSFQSPTAGGTNSDEPQWAASEAHLFSNLYNN